MSYAEQLFAIRESENFQLADSLAWFGEESYVYQDEELMLRLLKSKRAKKNTVAAYYLAKWCGEQGIAKNTYFGEGDKIAVYNDNEPFKRDITFQKLNTDYDDGTSLWMVSHPLFHANQADNVISTTSDENLDAKAQNFARADAYMINRFLSGGEDWYDETYDGDEWGSELDTTYLYTDENVLFQTALKKYPGFITGFDDDFADALVEIGTGVKVAAPTYDMLSPLSETTVGNFVKYDNNTKDNDVALFEDTGVWSSKFDTSNSYNTPMKATAFWVVFVSYDSSSLLEHGRSQGFISSTGSMFSPGNSSADVIAASIFSLSSINPVIRF